MPKMVAEQIITGEAWQVFNKKALLATSILMIKGEILKTQNKLKSNFKYKQMESTTPIADYARNTINSPSEFSQMSDQYGRPTVEQQVFNVNQRLLQLETTVKVSTYATIAMAFFSMCLFNRTQ